MIKYQGDKMPNDDCNLESAGRASYYISHWDHTCCLIRNITYLPIIYFVAYVYILSSW